MLTSGGVTTQTDLKKVICGQWSLDK